MTVMGPPGAAKPVFTFPIEDDPLPWLTDQFRAAGVFATTDPKDLLDPGIKDTLSGMSGSRPIKVISAFNLPTPKAMSAALGITSSVVTALSDHPKRFYVRFHPTKSTAATLLASREVIIGIRPMLDPRLTEGQRAALMVALAYHEVGHVIWTADMQARFSAKYGTSKVAHKVFNLVHDLLLEHQQAITYPGYAPTLRVKQAYWGIFWKAKFNSRKNRMGSLIQATLYPQGTDWTVDAETSEWFDWATDWAQRCRSVKAGKSPKYLFDLIDEGLEHLRLDEPDQPDPEPGEEYDEQEDGDDDPGGDESGPDPLDFDEEYDEDGDSTDDTFDDESEGGDDEDAPQRPPDPDESDDESGEEDEEQPKGTPTGSDTDEDDESGEDADEVPGGDDGDDEAGDTDEESEDGGSPGVGPAAEDEARDEFDDPRIPQAHPESEDDAEAWQDAIDDYERVQVTGRDKVVVGGGAWNRREARIIRL
jgi:hypothetical protein